MSNHWLLPTITNQLDGNRHQHDARVDVDRRWRSTCAGGSTRTTYARRAGTRDTGGDCARPPLPPVACDRRLSAPACARRARSRCGAVWRPVLHWRRRPTIDLRTVQVYRRCPSIDTLIAAIEGGTVDKVRGRCSQGAARDDQSHAVQQVPDRHPSGCPARA